MAGGHAKHLKRTILSRLTVSPFFNFIFGEPTAYELQPVSKAEFWGTRILLAVVAVTILGLLTLQMGY